MRTLWMAALALAGALARAASPDVDSIVASLQAAEKTNQQVAQSYGWHEDQRQRNRQQDGTLKQSRWVEYDVLFVEGAPYRRLVARNGQPLSSSDEAKEQRKLDKERQDRRIMRRKGLLGLAISYTYVHIPVEHINRLFVPTLQGEEAVDGRPAFVLRLEPLPGAVPANAAEKAMLCRRATIWIDQAEHVRLQQREEVFCQADAMLPGTVFESSWTKHAGEVWLECRSLISFNAKVPLRTLVGETEALYTNFRKYDVASTITFDEPSQ